MFIVSGLYHRYSQLLICQNYSSYHKLLISQSKFSGHRKFTLRYKKFETKGAEMKIKNRKCIQIIFSDIREYFEISMSEISRFDLIFAIVH